MYNLPLLGSKSRSRWIQNRKSCHSSKSQPKIQHKDFKKSPCFLFKSRATVATVFSVYTDHRLKQQYLLTKYSKPLMISVFGRLVFLKTDILRVPNRLFFMRDNHRAGEPLLLCSVGTTLNTRFHTTR